VVGALSFSNDGSGGGLGQELRERRLPSLPSLERDKAPTTHAFSL